MSEFIDAPQPDANYDVFISYAHQDAEPVRAIREALCECGLRVWMNENEITDFSSITRAIRDGLVQSKIFLPFYSKIYPLRRACQSELTSAFIAAQSDRQGVASRFAVVNAEPQPDHIHPIELKDALFRNAPATGDQGALRALADAVKVHAAKAEGPIGNIQRTPNPRWYGAHGTGSERFVGRAETFWTVHSKLQASGHGIITDAVGPDVAVVEGLGGAGKSLLAEEYALRFGAAYPGGVFWIYAHGDDSEREGWSQKEREARRLQQLRYHAAAIGVEGQITDINNIESAIAHRLKERSEICLWIVDDLPADLDPAEARQWLSPTPLAKTLITTRNRNHGLRGRVDLAGLGHDEALDLLCRHRAPEGPEEAVAARQLTEALGRHALAVDVAGAALKQAGTTSSFSGFLSAIADPTSEELEFAGTLAGALPNGHETSIVSTLSRSIEGLGAEGREFLRLASVLAEAPIPTSLVAEVLGTLGEFDERTASRRALLAQAQMDERSLATLDGAVDDHDQSWGRSVHTLVLRTAHTKDENDEALDLVREAAVNALERKMPEFTPGAVLDSLIAHSETLLRRCGSLSLHKSLAYVSWKRGDHERAVHHLHEIVRGTNSMAAIGITAPQALAWVELGDQLNFMGKTEEARDAFKQGRELYCEGNLPTDDVDERLEALDAAPSDESAAPDWLPGILESNDQLANYQVTGLARYAQQLEVEGRHSEATPLWRRLLADQSDSVDAMALAIHKVNLSSNLLTQGASHWEEADALLEAAIPGFGDSEMLVHVLANFTATLVRIDRATEAKVMAWRAVTEGEKHAPNDHGEIALQVLSSLFQAFYSSQAPEMARELLVEAIALARTHRPDDDKLLSSLEAALADIGVNDDDDENDAALRERFTDEEWQQLKQIPFQIFFVVAMADGKVDAKEIAAFVNRTEAAASLDNPLLRELMHGLSQDEIRNHLANPPSSNEAEQLSRTVRAILRDKLVPGEKFEFIGAALALGLEVAQASGGFFGLGSKVSKVEKQALGLWGAFYALDAD